ncbi:MAG: trimeric autotransporter adhesin, partial [Solirubrobacteraceae bacterium]|nr:trimeric autotransporter adhesin [Solirubrobacteraceae bacterium]
VGVADEWGKGIEIFGAGADGNQVIGNYVGTDITGSGPLGNLRHGVWIGSGAGTLGTPAGADVGDGTTNGRNVIAANGEEGIYVLDSPSVKVRGNLIGLGLDGRAAGNGFRGIAIENAQDAVIGGATTGERNVVSANGFSASATEEFEGIIVFGPNAKNVKIQGNYIGTNLAGDAITDPGGVPTGNKSSGVSLATRTDLGGATDGLVGGTLAAQRNVISGNDVGVVILNRATHDHVEGNYIGTDATGTAALPNHFAGAMIYAADENVIGGTAAGARNLISGNANDGVRIQWDEPTATPARKNKLQGNYIGVAADGTTPLPNLHAVTLLGTATDNVIGYDRTATDADLAAAKACDVGACNRIVSNKGVGIWVHDDGTVNNTIRGNRISDNKFLGIDLAKGNMTPNDVDDSDTGANGLLNFPVAVSTYKDPETGQNRISGKVVGPNPDKLKVDIYSDSQPDPLHYGEGRTWEGSVTPAKDGSFVWDYAAATGKFFSATATDENGNTSEFSAVCDDPDGDGSTDSDGDGLCDSWETTGIDFDGDGVVDLPLGSAPYSADPARKDLFLEVDYMDAFFHTHKPEPGALTDVVAAFAAAPVDGGKGIALHVSPGSASGVDDAVSDVELLKTQARGPGSADDFVDLRDGDPTQPCDGSFGTQADRDSGGDTCWKVLGAKAMAFRYAIFGHTFEECADCSGVADTGGDNLLVSLAAWPDASLIRDGGGLSTCLDLANCKRQVEAGTLMHEFGHTLQLGHAGRIDVNDDHNFKPNYLSVMNYTFQFRRTTPLRPLDYSRWKLSPLNEASLMEGKGIDNGAPPAGLASWGKTAFTHYDAGSDKCIFEPAPVLGGIDFNWNGPIDGVAISAGINEPDGHPDSGQEACQQAALFQNLQGHDDWSNLHFDQRDLSGWSQLGAGESISNYARELTDAQQQQLAEISDSDGDGVSNATDNCVLRKNPGQEDADGDGIGDACQGPAPDPPANSTAPAITPGGTPHDGDTLTASQGTWTGTEPITYDYAWFA